MISLDAVPAQKSKRKRDSSEECFAVKKSRPITRSNSRAASCNCK